MHFVVGTKSPGAKTKRNHLVSPTHTSAVSLLRNRQCMSEHSELPEDPQPPSDEVVPVTVKPSLSPDALYNFHVRIYTGVMDGLSHRQIVNQLEGEKLQGVELPEQYKQRHHVRELIHEWSEVLKAKVISTPPNKQMSTIKAPILI